jgi:hypothetical protein
LTLLKHDYPVRGSKRLSETSGQQQLQNVAATRSILFNNLAAPVPTGLADLHAARARLREELAFTDGALDADSLLDILAGIRDAKHDIEELEYMVQCRALPHFLSRFENETAALTDPEAPDIGLRFIDRLRASNCTTVIRRDISGPAVYVSYDLGAPEGFINQIGLNTSKISSDNSAFKSSLRHELFHGFQKGAAEALHCSPFNPATKVIVHPMEWVRLERLCEADAYARQGFFNWLDAKDDPSVRHSSRFDAVSVDDFEEHRLREPTLARALTQTALIALSKPLCVGDSSFLFEDHYHGVALDHFSAAMRNRHGKGESGLRFVRLEPSDMHAVGNYNIGPNALGECAIDPAFLAPISLKPAHVRQLKDICNLYGIPDLEDCPTLREEISAPRPDSNFSAWPAPRLP